MAKEVIGLDNILIIASFLFYDHRHHHLDGSICCLSMVSITWSDVQTELPQPVQVSHMWLAYEMPLPHDLQRHAGSQSVRSVAQILRSQCYFLRQKTLFHIAFISNKVYNFRLLHVTQSGFSSEHVGFTWLKCDFTLYLTTGFVLL